MHKVFSDSTNKICEDLVSKLSGRVVAAYIFGSRAVKDDSLYSDSEKKIL